MPVDLRHVSQRYVCHFTIVGQLLEFDDAIRELFYVLEQIY